MNDNRYQITNKQFFIAIALLVSITDIAIFLNMPILRQILGAIFLAILPGVLILLILRLYKLSFLEKCVLSIGLSISFLMLSGLLLNNLSLSLGYLTPLSTITLLIFFNLVFIILAIIGYKVNENRIFFLPNLNLNTSEKVFLIVPILFPALSIFGMQVMNTTGNNIILIFLLFLIPIYITFICFFNKKFPNRLYPVVILLISISLLLLFSLRSNHILGSDIHSEYFYFQTTLNNLHWSTVGGSLLDACLSISLLPTIYESILKVTNTEYLFKILYSLLYSISPLIIYIISKKYIKKSYAFLASCFYMFQANFLWTAYCPRTTIALLFFTLSMMILFSGNIGLLKKKILFIVFMASCIVSHYSTAYIFFFVILGSFLTVKALSKKYTVQKIINLNIVVLFFALIFFWYSQLTKAPFGAGVGYIKKTISNFGNFFIIESRKTNVQALLGKDVVQKGIPHKIEFMFTWLTFALIGIGIITLIMKYKGMSFTELKSKNLDFLKKIELEYFVMALACSGLLVAIVALPFLSNYGIGRSYAVATTILSIFFVIGGIMLVEYILFFIKNPFASKNFYGKKYLQKLHIKGKNKSYLGKTFFSKKRIGGKKGSDAKAYLVILLVLIPYFLCVTGVVYNIFGVPRSILLNSEGEQYLSMYVHDTDVISSEWLNKYAYENAEIYADHAGRLMLGWDGMPNITSLYFIRNSGYIYLTYATVLDKRENVVGNFYDNLANYGLSLINESKTYSNGYSEIYKPQGVN